MKSLKMMHLKKAVLAIGICSLLILYPTAKVLAAPMTYDWSLNPTIGYGYTTAGDYVLSLQYMLWVTGYTGSNGYDLVRDGSFGSNTSYALKNCQRDIGLAADGICGKATWAEFRSATVMWGSDRYGIYFEFIPDQLVGGEFETGVRYFQEARTGWWYLGTLKPDGTEYFILVD